MAPFDVFRVVLALVVGLVVPASALAQPEGYESPVTAREVVDAANRVGAILARPVRASGLDEARRALEAFAATDAFYNRALRANGVFEPAAARELTARFGVRPEALAELHAPSRRRCRLAARRAHALGRDMLLCFGATQTAFEQRVAAGRLASLPGAFVDGDVAASHGVYALALSSLASSREPDTVTSLLRTLVAMELAVGDTALARRRLTALGASPEDEIARADVDFVAGDVAGAQRRLRALVRRSPSNAVAHLALARLAMNVRLLASSADAVLAREVFDHARAAVCVAPDDTPREVFQGALDLLSALRSSDYGDRPWSWWSATQPQQPLILPPFHIPPWWIGTRLDRELPAIETCRALLDRVSPGASVRPPWP